MYVVLIHCAKLSSRSVHLENSVAIPTDLISDDMVCGGVYIYGCVYVVVCVELISCEDIHILRGPSAVGEP